MRTRAARRLAVAPLALLLPLLLAACAGEGPRLATPGAVHALESLQAMESRAAWDGLAAAEVPECGGPDDAVCAARQALHARGCQHLGRMDCAVDGYRAALAAGEATPAETRTGWRMALAGALFARRQAAAGEALCADNAALRLEADRLLAELPAEPRPRFLAASARLTAVARGCTPQAGCTDLAAARALLHAPPPEAAPQWRALGAGIAATARRLACPT